MRIARVDFMTHSTRWPKLIIIIIIIIVATISIYDADQ